MIRPLAPVLSDGRSVTGESGIKYHFEEKPL